MQTEFNLEIAGETERLRERLDAELRECLEHDRTGVLPRFWRQRLARFDLTALDAPDQVGALVKQVRRYRSQYPFGFPSDQWGRARLLAMRLDGLADLFAELRLHCGERRRERARPPTARPRLPELFSLLRTREA